MLAKLPSGLSSFVLEWKSLSPMSSCIVASFPGTWNEDPCSEIITLEVETGSEQ